MENNKNRNINSNPSPNTEVEESLISRLLQFLFGLKWKNLDYKNLKKICKGLKKQGFNFYAMHAEKVTGKFADVLYNVYTTIAPIKDFFQTISESEDFKKSIILYSFTQKQQILLQRFDDNTIYNLAEKDNINSLVKDVKESFLTFKKEYTIEKIEQTNELYRDITILRSFCTLDYYFILKKFCSSLVEDDFSKKINFSSVFSKYVSENIIDFVNESECLLRITNWDGLFDFLSTIPKAPSFDRIEFKKMVEKLFILENQDVLKSMAKLVKNDSNYEPDISIKDEDIVHSYLDERYSEIRNILENIYAEKKRNHIFEVINKIFPGSTSFSMKYYNEEQSRKYYDIGCGSFKWQEPLSYLKVFINLIIKENCHEFVETIAIRSKSLIPDFVTSFTSLYHDLCDKLKEIEMLDSSLDSKFPLGYRFKSLYDHLHTDPDAKIKLTSELNALNAKFGIIIKTSVNKIDEFYKMLIKLKDDSGKEMHEIIDNWNELSRYFSEPAKHFLDSNCKKINYFIVLVKDFGFLTE